MQLQNNKSIKGYTLIELLVVITIITLLFTIGYAGFREFSQRQSLQGSAKIVLSDLRYIQQLALTGQKPEGVSCTILSGYTFRSSAGEYDLIANCSNGNRTIKSVVLDGASVQGPTVKFKVLGQGTSLDGDATIRITQDVTDDMATITVGKGGEIK